MSSSVAPSSDSAPQPVPNVDHIDPTKVRVVDIECESTGTVYCRDCYDPIQQRHPKMDYPGQSVFKVVDDIVYLRTIDWARSSSPDAKAEVIWEATGLTTDEVTRIRIYTWPRAEPGRTFQYRV